MALASDVKQKVISEYRLHDDDVGSPEVQVAVLSQRLVQLNEHFKLNQHDHNSRQGLLKMVARRRRLLKYLKNNAPERYKELIARLGIRR